MNIVCIIPARGGSKGIPNKNLVDFCGHPLLRWTIRQARESKYIKNVYVTSDDLNILALASNNGAILIKRPEDISGDIATSESALLHALDHIDSFIFFDQPSPDLIVFLQATSPLRTTEHIDNAIKYLIDNNCDSVFSAVEMPDFLIWGHHNRISYPQAASREEAHEKLRSINYNYDDRKRRQDSEKQYIENGSIYVFKPSILKGYNNRLGGKIGMSIMPTWTMHEIDDMDGLGLCEYLMNKHILTKK